VGPLAGVPADVEGYVLRVEAGHVVALWSDSPRGFSLPLPLPGSVRCFNRDGGPIDCPVDAGRVSLELQTGAIYVVIAP
jgi:hypothetical protein